MADLAPARGYLESKSSTFARGHVFNREDEGAAFFGTNWDHFTRQAGIDLAYARFIEITKKDALANPNNHESSATLLKALFARVPAEDSAKISGMQTDGMIQFYRSRAAANSDMAANAMFGKLHEEHVAPFRGGRRRKTKKSKRRARKTRRRHK